MPLFPRTKKMSFQDLWDQIDLVIRHSELRREGVEELTELLKLRAEIEVKYYKGMEKLASSLKCVSRNGTLAQAVDMLKGHWLNRASKSKAMSEMILRDLIMPLEVLVTHQSPLAKQQAKEGQKLEKTLHVKMDKHDKAQQRYLKSCKEAEIIALSLEDEAIPGERKSKLIQRLPVVKADLDVSLEQYIASLEEVNSYRKKYIDDLKDLLRMYQDQDELRVEQMKLCLKKVLELEIECIKSAHLDFGDINLKIEAISPKGDIELFVNKHRSARAHEAILEFRPYEGSHPLFRPASFPLMFLKDDWVELVLAAQSDHFDTQVEIVVDKAWEGELIDKETLAAFEGKVSSAEGRKTWVSSMNRKRAKRLLEIEEPGFRPVCKLLDIVLGSSLESSDMSSLRSCIIIAQTFSLKGSTPKMYLQALIADHPLWRDPNFWQKLLQNTIDTEFRNFAEMCLEAKENTEVQAKIKGIVFAQLNSFGQMMQSFECKSKEAGDLLRSCALRFGLPTHHVEAILVSSKQTGFSTEPAPIIPQERESSSDSSMDDLLMQQLEDELREEAAKGASGDEADGSGEEGG